MAVRAAGLIIFRQVSTEIQYLMMQTSYGEHHWTPPKGHVDPGESDFETAVRETREESGLKEDDFKVLEFKKELNYNVNGKPKVVTYWLAELTNNSAKVILSNEHQNYEWAVLERACELAKYEDLQSLLRDCNRYLCEHLGKSRE